MDNYTPAPYLVYAQTDDHSRITAVNSSAFVSADWGTEIDFGFGDRYHHAQDLQKQVDECHMLVEVEREKQQEPDIHQAEDDHQSDPRRSRDPTFGGLFHFHERLTLLSPHWPKPEITC